MRPLLERALVLGGPDKPWDAHTLWLLDEMLSLWMSSLTVAPQSAVQGPSTIS